MVPVDFNELRSDVTAAPSWLAARPNESLAIGLHLMRPIEIPLQLDFFEQTLQVLPANTSSRFLVHGSRYTWRAWATLSYRSGGQQWLTLATVWSSSLFLGHLSSWLLAIVSLS